ncbi:MAG: NAD-dependent epimerase/dehydratase family protein [Sandaracinaceae bacterium]
MRMRALVLGATGFAGSAIARRLIADGHEVVALVREAGAAEVDGRPARLRNPLPPEVAVHRGSIGDPNEIAAAAEGTDVVFVAVGLPQGRPVQAYRWLHVAGLENVLTAARHRGVPRVVLISCADVVLADEERVHWDEKRDLSHPPLGARARAMKLAEEIALSQSDEALAVTAVRPGWLWGPGDRTRVAELVREGREGGIELCGNGKNLVATTYVEHLVDAALAAAVSPSAPGQAYYVGDAEFLEVGEFLGMLSRALTLPPPRTAPFYTVRRLWASMGRGGLPVEEVVRRGRGTYFDTQKLATELGLEPTVGVDEGMKRLRAWFEDVRDELVPTG